MYKTIFKFIIAISLTLLYEACRKSDIAPFSMGGAAIDLTGASISADGTSVSLYFSTDNGATFTPTTVMHSGQQILVKVWDANYNNAAGAFLTGAGSQFLQLDWSGSNPKPSSTTGGVATFTYTSDLKIAVKITDTHCAYDLNTYLGGWYVDEGSAIEVDSSGVKLTKNLPKPGNYLAALSQDPSNPNKVWMANVRGLGLNAYMVFNPSTNYFDQTVSIPSQSIGSKGATFSGSGSYDQCRSALTLSVVYAYVDTVTIDTVRQYVYKDTTFVRGDVTIDSVIQKSVVVTPQHDIYVPYQVKWTYNFDSTGTIPAYCAYNASSWTGSWTGVEGPSNTNCGGAYTGSNDALTIAVDPSKTNGFIISNWWGDGTAVKVKFQLNPSTNYFDQLVTLPGQTTSEGGVVSAANGSYNQCTGVLTIPASYNIGGCTYNWTYKIHQ